MDSCPGGQAVQYRKRVENRVQIVVNLGLSVADGEGVSTWRVRIKYPENSLNGGTGINKT